MLNHSEQNMFSSKGKWTVRGRTEQADKQDYPSVIVLKQSSLVLTHIITVDVNISVAELSMLQ